MKKIFALILILYFAGCEQTVESEDLPYKPKLVVRGLLEANKSVSNIYIGRTVPVSIPYSSSFADLTDAIAAIEYDDVRIILRHDGQGKYSAPGLVAQPGTKYRIYVQHENLSASAETLVPRWNNITPPTVRKELRNGVEESFIEVTTTPYTNQVFGATWARMNVNNSIQQEASEFYAIFKQTNSSPIKVATVNVPANILSQGTSLLAIRVYSYDEPYYDYFLSRGANQISDAVFGQPSGNVKWNIKGEGIGMFIARADTLIRFQ